MTVSQNRIVSNEETKKNEILSILQSMVDNFSRNSESSRENKDAG